MLQSALFEGPPFDCLPPVQDGLCPSEVDVGGREIAAVVVVMIDEGLNMGFEIARQAVVLGGRSVL